MAFQRGAFQQDSFQSGPLEPRDAFQSFGFQGFAFQIGAPGQGGTPPPPAATPDDGYPWHKPRRKTVRIKRSDFAHQQEYADAVAKAAAELAAESLAMRQIADADGRARADELEDDEIILLALTKLLH